MVDGQYREGFEKSEIVIVWHYHRTKLSETRGAGGRQREVEGHHCSIHGRTDLQDDWVTWPEHSHFIGTICKRPFTSLSTCMLTLSWIAATLPQDWSIPVLLSDSNVKSVVRLSDSNVHDTVAVYLLKTKNSRPNFWSIPLESQRISCIFSMAARLNTRIWKTSRTYVAMKKTLAFLRRCMWCCGWHRETSRGAC